MSRPTRYEQRQALADQREGNFPADDRARADAIQAHAENWAAEVRLWDAEVNAYRGRNGMICRALIQSLGRAEERAGYWTDSAREALRRAVKADRAELVAAGLLDPDAALGANLRTEVTP